MTDYPFTENDYDGQTFKGIESGTQPGGGSG